MRALKTAKIAEEEKRREDIYVEDMKKQLCEAKATLQPLIKMVYFFNLFFICFLLDFCLCNGWAQRRRQTRGRTR